MSASEMMFFISLLVVLVLVLAVAQQPPSTAPTPSANCMQTIFNNMGDCCDYVARNSSVESPPGSCCDGLATVVKNDFQCVCQLLQNGDPDGRLSINRTRVLRLPSICDVAATLSQCQTGGPASSSAPSKPTTVGILLLTAVPTVFAVV